MGDYDKQLEELQEQIAKKKSEEAILEDLRKRQKELEDQLYELECQKQEEQVESFLIELNTMLTRNKQAQNRLEDELDRLVRGMQM